MKRARNVLVVSAAAFLFCLGSADDAESASNGINALIAVAQQKADQANSDALEAAKKQRSLIKKTKDKNAQARLNELAKLNTQHAKTYAQLAKQLKEVRVQLSKTNCD